MKIPPPSNQTTGEPSFRWRRIAFFGITGLCLIFIPTIPFLPDMDDQDVRVMNALLDTIGWVYLVYAGAATGQDIAAIVTTRSGRPYADNVQSVDPPPANKTTVVSDTTTVTGGPVNVQADPAPPPDMQGS